MSFNCYRKLSIKGINTETLKKYSGLSDLHWRGKLTVTSKFSHNVISYHR